MVGASLGFWVGACAGALPKPGGLGALVEEEVFAIFLQVLSTLTFVCWVMLCMS